MMNCSQCGKETIQTKDFVENGVEKHLCPDCYVPYFTDPVKRSAVVALPQDVM